MNQIPLAFRYRIANDSIDLKIRTGCVDPINIFEGFCRNLTGGALLPGLKTAKGQKSAKQGGKDATNFSQVSHAKTNQLLLLLSGPLQQFKHFQVVCKVPGVGNDFDDISRHFAHGFIQRIEIFGSVRKVVIRKNDSCGVPFFQEGLQIFPGRGNFNIHIIGSSFQGISKRLQAVFIGTFKLSTIKFGAVSNDDRQVCRIEQNIQVGRIYQVQTQFQNVGNRRSGRDLFLSFGHGGPNNGDTNHRGILQNIFSNQRQDSSRIKAFKKTKPPIPQSFI